MSAITFFDEDRHGKLRGSEFGEPDDTEHKVELLKGNGRMILRVQLADMQRPVDLLFTVGQSVAFTDAAKTILEKLGFNNLE